MGEKVLLNSSEIKKSGNSSHLYLLVYITIRYLYYFKGEIYTMEKEEKRKIYRELTKEMLQEYGFVDVYYDNEV